MSDFEEWKSEREIVGDKKKNDLDDVNCVVALYERSMSVLRV